MHSSREHRVGKKDLWKRESHGPYYPTPPHPTPPMNTCTRRQPQRSMSFICKFTWTLIHAPPHPTPPMNTCTCRQQKRSMYFICKFTWTLIHAPHPTPPMARASLPPLWPPKSEKGWQANPAATTPAPFTTGHNFTSEERLLTFPLILSAEPCWLYSRIIFWFWSTAATAWNPEVSIPWVIPPNPAPSSISWRGCQEGLSCMNTLVSSSTESTGIGNCCTFQKCETCVSHALDPNRVSWQQRELSDLACSIQKTPAVPDPNPSHSWGYTSPWLVRTATPAGGSSHTQIGTSYNFKHASSRFTFASSSSASGIRARNPSTTGRFVHLRSSSRRRAYSVSTPLGEASDSAAVAVLTNWYRWIITWHLHACSIATLVYASLSQEGGPQQDSAMLTHSSRLVNVWVDGGYRASYIRHGYSGIHLHTMCHVNSGYSNMGWLVNVVGTNVHIAAWPHLTPK